MKSPNSGADAESPLLTVAEAAKSLSISPRTLRELIFAGEIPAIHVSRRRIAIHPDDLRVFIARRKYRRGDDR